MAGLGEQKLVSGHLMQSDWHNDIVPSSCDHRDTVDTIKTTVNLDI